jgi:Ser/Thr protein kinase RdoA (MazF antagonist)
LLETLDGAAFWKDEEGALWRCYRAQPGTETVDAVEDPSRAYEAARAFGRFSRLLSDLPAPPLAETIPGFHDSPARLRALEGAARNASDALRAQSEDARAFAAAHRGLAGRVGRDLPARVCHYDTKVNNVLFDRLTRKALCVVDLDTVSPGLLPLDFGDLVRSAASEAPEDCRDLERVVARPAVLEALAAGYLEELAPVLTAPERAALADAPAELAFELGVRFLTDFLEGDVYFKTHRPLQNLDRARVQFQLAEAFVRERALLARFCGV